MQRIYNVTLWYVRFCHGNATVSSCIIALCIAVKYTYLKRCHEEATVSLWRSYVAVNKVYVLRSLYSVRQFCSLITTFWLCRKMLIKVPSTKPRNNPPRGQWADIVRPRTWRTQLAVFATFTNAPKSASRWSAVNCCQQSTGMQDANFTFVCLVLYHDAQCWVKMFSRKNCFSYANNSVSVGGDCIAGYSFSYLWCITLQWNI
jgi:hypothetical protein